MPTHVAVLRGINLGPRNRVAMPALRDLVASLGHTDVATYIQSGNVVFTAKKVDAAALERAIESELGVAAPVVVVSRDELERIVRDNPYADEPNTKAVHAVFFGGEPPAALAGAIDAANARATERGSADEARVAGRTLYIHTPDGFGPSDLAKALMRKATGGTARNWATVTKLLELLRA